MIQITTNRRQPRQHNLTFSYNVFFIDNTYQRKKEAEDRSKQISQQDLQLQRLRTTPGGNDNPLSMAFNPHYGSEGFLPQGIDVRELPQVSRESLKLVKWVLGPTKYIPEIVPEIEYWLLLSRNLACEPAGVS